MKGSDPTATGAPGRGRTLVVAKGNSDVAESLFFCRDPDGTCWNGLNEVLRGSGGGWRVRVSHEVMTRSDALLAAPGRVPEALAHLRMERPYDLPTQFSDAFYDARAGAHILSVQADVSVTLARHRETGCLLHPYGFSAWPAEQKAWLAAACDHLPLITPDESLRNFTAIIARLRLNSDAPVLIYNMSSVVPGETVSRFAGLGDTLETRIRRFNLMLVALSAATDATVVDVDRLVARRGADRLKRDGFRLTCEGNRLVAENVVDLLGRHESFAERDRPG